MPSGQSEVAVEERREFVEHGLLLERVVAAGREPGDGRQDLGDRGAGGGDGAVAEGVGDEGAGLVGLEALRDDERVELLGLLRVDEAAPVLAGVAGDVDRVDEGQDEVALVAQGDAGVDGALDVHQRGHLDVGAVAAGLAPLLDEQQDVVDVDLDLLDELDLEDDVVVDRLLLGRVLAAELGVQVEVDAAVVLEVALGQDLVAGEVVEGDQDVAQPQDRAEQRDELLLRCLADDRLVRAGTASVRSATSLAYSA